MSVSQKKRSSNGKGRETALPFRDALWRFWEGEASCASSTCLSHVWQMSKQFTTCTMCFRWMSAWLVHVLVKADMPGRGCGLCLQVHHMQVNQKEPKRTDTSWPSSSSSSSECGKSSGDTKPVPAKHCLETCLIQALQCEQDSGWTFLSLSQKDWLSRYNGCQRFPHWLHDSSPTKPQNPCLFAMLCGGFEKVKVPSHPAHLIFVSIVSRITFHAHVMCLCCLHHLQISNIWSWRQTHEKHRKALRLLAEANMSLRWGLSRGTLYLDSQAKHDMGNQNQELQVCGGLQHLFNVRHANKHANTACSTSSSSDSGRSAGATKPVPDIKTQHLQSAARTAPAQKNNVLHVLWMGSEIN